VTSRYRAVLFDLGNTLAAYYRPEQFAPILQRSVSAVTDELRRRGVRTPDADEALAAAHTENREAADFRFAPMRERLARIFGLPADTNPELMHALCTRFLEPIFAIGTVYDDAIPVLRGLRSAGYRTAIVSNAPWGSPPELWRGALAKLALADEVDAVVLCGDVGWRKPASQIFREAASRVGADCERCVFVGDELQWDVAGSASAGMLPVLIDRDDRHPHHPGRRIRTLTELPAMLASLD
jgi:putative hydrolase of the HAD superfamily